MIVTDSMMQKVYEPGLWFLKSSRPSSDICDLIYELAVKGGARIFVKAQQNKNIQSNVITRVMKDRLDEATDQNERDWLEQEMTGYHEHGFFDYPEEMNDYIENGYFWNYTVILMDDLHEIGNYNNDIIILEDINDLQYGDEKDLLKILQLNHEDAIEYKDTMIILVQEKSYGPATEFIETHLFV